VRRNGLGFLNVVFSVPERYAYSNVFARCWIDILFSVDLESKWMHSSSMQSDVEITEENVNSITYSLRQPALGVRNRTKRQRSFVHIRIAEGFVVLPSSLQFAATHGLD
jgi:hypothetical protein